MEDVCFDIDDQLSSVNGSDSLSTRIHSDVKSSLNMNTEEAPTDYLSTRTRAVEDNNNSSSSNSDSGKPVNGITFGLMSQEDRNQLNVSNMHELEEETFDQDRFTRDNNNSNINNNDSNNELDLDENEEDDDDDWDQEFGIARDEIRGGQQVIRRHCWM